MRRVNSLALFVHPSRLEDAVILLKAHTRECSSFEIIYGGENAGEIRSGSGIHLTLFTSNFRRWDEYLLDMLGRSTIRGLIYLGDPQLVPADNPLLLQLIGKGVELDIPVALNLSSAEALIHLMDDFPEALSGHHLAAQYLEEIAYQH